MTFSSGKEMLDYITDGHDLYAPLHGFYVFHYNDRGAIALYIVRQETAIILERDSRASGEYWGAFLGPGGWIYDAAEDCGEGGTSNLMFCDVFYSELWIPTAEVLDYYGND